MKKSDLTRVQAINFVKISLVTSRSNEKFWHEIGWDESVPTVPKSSVGPEIIEADNTSPPFV